MNEIERAIEKRDRRIAELERENEQLRGFIEKVAGLGLCSDYQHERADIVEYIYNTRGIVARARELLGDCGESV